MLNQIQISKFKLFNFEFLILNSKFVQVVIFLLTVILFPRLVSAEALNNKYGIHLAQPSIEALQEAKDLINSSGGDWGYVTLVMQEDDRNREKWQEIFDKMREYHLIPIVRLATKPEGEAWRRPLKEDAETWVDFLDSLNWVVKERYIILFNEPNHGAEWGGEVDPQNYAEVAKSFSEKLKQKNKDYFIMLAGMDASAPSYPPNMEDEQVFLRQMIHDSGFMIQDNIDGLASHSYPNPGFVGSAYDTGRKSIRGYEWELELFKSLRVEKDLPVFITETGWVHQCQNSNVKCQNEATIANYFQVAYENVWGPDARVKAVTPFVLDYQGEPFLGFSWKRFQSQEFYSQYYLVQSLLKQKGEPEQINKGQLRFDFPKELVAKSNYHFRLKIKNLGQAIWDKNNGYRLIVTRLPAGEAAGNSGQDGYRFEFMFSDLSNVEPFEEAEVDFYIKTDGASGKYKTKINLMKNEKEVTQNKDWIFEVLPLPQLKAVINLYPKLKTSGNDFKIQVFDEKEEMVFQKKLKVTNKEGIIDDVQNIALGRKYRVVVLKPYYLPRQEYVVFNRGLNEVKFKLMYPLDFNKDGKFSGEDLLEFFKNLKLISLFLP